ncbi:MAG: MerR family transcriptional regulator [Gemmatimonadota bacterium]
MHEHEARHAIGAVVRVTGLTADALRVWERRYGVVKPERTEGGHRLYTDAQVRRLSLLKRAVDLGERISQLTDLGDEELERLIDGSQGVEAPEPSSSRAARCAVHLEASRRGVPELDAKGIEASLRRALLALGPTEFLEGVLVPFLYGVGASWERDEITPAHEHAASTAVRRVLTWLLEASDSVEGAPRIVVATPLGERHEFGAMLVAVTAGLAGWSVLYLGVDLPASDVVVAANSYAARVVALSLVWDGGAEALVGELAVVAAGLGEDVKLLVGGRASALHAGLLGDLGALRLRDLGSLRNTLNVLAGGWVAGVEV